MTNSGNWIVPYKERVNSVLESLLPEDNSILTKAISYSVLNGGKRLRPLLVYLSSELGKSTSEAQDLVSCAVELIHCYSLIHDDIVQPLHNKYSALPTLSPLGRNLHR